MKIRDLSPPGEIIREMMQERGMSSRDLSIKSGLPEWKVMSILYTPKHPDGKLYDTEAEALAKVFSVPSSFLLNLETNYRNEQEKKRL